jgi:hypothetical protein
VILAIAAAAVASGCDAEPEAPEPLAEGSLLGRSGSELDTTGDVPGGDAALDGDDHSGGPPAGVEAIVSPGGQDTAVDSRMEPDPIPWTPRVEHGNDA